MDIKKYILFDYLEGNLDKSMETELMDSIANDPSFNQECKLWEKSFIQPKSVIYQHKNDLIKSSLINLNFIKIAGLSVLTIVITFLILNYSKVNTASEEKIVQNTQYIATKSKEIESMPSVYELKSNKDINIMAEKSIAAKERNGVDDTGKDKLTPECLAVQPLELRLASLNIDAEVQTPELAKRNIRATSVQSKSELKRAKRLKRRLLKPSFKQKLKNLKMSFKGLRWNKEDVVEINDF